MQIPGTSITGSAFTYFDPGTSAINTTATNAAYPDTISTVSLWPPNFGGGVSWFSATPGALADCPVNVNAVGDVIEADIVANTYNPINPNAPFFTYLENNIAYGQIIATNDHSPGSATAQTIFGLADQQGVLTHEFGHYAGLGHSLIETSGDALTTTFPTIFPYDQAQPLAPTTVV